jgi:hypothetical protein
MTEAGTIVPAPLLIRRLGELLHRNHSIVNREAAEDRDRLTRHGDDAYRSGDNAAESPIRFDRILVKTSRPIDGRHFESELTTAAISRKSLRQRIRARERSPMSP